MTKTEWLTEATMEYYDLTEASYKFCKGTAEALWESFEEEYGEMAVLRDIEPIKAVRDDLGY